MPHAFQTLFAQNLLAPMPPSISKRFAVYRNNVFVSLVEALQARFPAVQNAVGTEFFVAIARDYAGSHGPTSPLMMQYGNGFPDFLETLPALADYPWMADLARVECTITQSYHAADAPPHGPDAFAATRPEELGHLTMTLHPALQLVHSAFPIVTLWQMNSGQAGVCSIDDHAAETALIHRPHLSVSVHPLTTAGHTFLKTLHAGFTLGEATDWAVATDASFDLTTHLRLLIAHGCITALQLPQSERT